MFPQLMFIISFDLSQNPVEYQFQRTRVLKVALKFTNYLILFYKTFLALALSTFLWNPEKKPGIK